MANPVPHIAAHLEWIGFVRPTGLVVSAAALDRAGAILDRRDAEGQRLLRECIEESCFPPGEEPRPGLSDFQAFASSVLGWSFSPRGYSGTDEVPIPAELEAALSDSGGILRPDFAVRTEPLRHADDAPPWQLLVQVCDPGEDFDRVARAGDGLEASLHGRMERLLRHTGVPAGTLFNGLALRLISAPRGESSGWLDFRVADMVQTAGRPISTAMRLLLHEKRLLTLPRPQRLAALLEDSRKYQNEVSERLAQQVLHALYELLRGFQAAHDRSGRKLLRQPLEEGPDEVYRGQLTLVQSNVHGLWARFFSATMKDDINYSPSDCFETFPLPDAWDTCADLETAADMCYDFRAKLMVSNREGLTKTYNRFHDPHEDAPEVVTLRSLHAAMDRAVLDAYGWRDIPTDCDFLLDYEIDEEEWGSRKKPYRYRWPDDVCDEVLARLLERQSSGRKKSRLLLLMNPIGRVWRDSSPVQARRQAIYRPALLREPAFFRQR